MAAIDDYKKMLGAKERRKEAKWIRIGLASIPHLR